MKKIMIALAVAAMAVASQAATIKWATAENLTGVDIATVAGNGVFGAGGSELKNNSVINFAITLYTAGTTDEIGTYSGVVKYATGKKIVGSSFTIADAALNTTYDYILTVTGTQNDLTGVIGDWDYTDATIATKVSGTFKTASSGTTTLTADPSTWTVSGAVEAVPEPTSAMLLLLGMAGLALKRKQA